MSEHIPNLLGLALLVLGAFFILSVLAFCAMFRFWGPVAAERGMGGFLFLLGCFALSAVLSRPYVFEGVPK